VTVLSKQRLAAVMDAGAIAVSIGYAVGRMGCFLRGDDYGKPTDLPWGIAFPEGLPPTTVKVHPTQLYEIAGSLVIFALLVWVISPRFKREGPLIFVYAILAGIARFLVEFVRDKNDFVWPGITQQQWIAIAMIVVGIAGTWWFGTHGKLRPPIDPATGRPEVVLARGGKAGPEKTGASKSGNKSGNKSGSGPGNKSSTSGKRKK